MVPDVLHEHVTALFMKHTGVPYSTEHAGPNYTIVSLYPVNAINYHQYNVLTTHRCACDLEGDFGYTQSSKVVH